MSEENQNVDQRTEQELAILAQLDEANAKVEVLEKENAGLKEEVESLKEEVARLIETPDEQEQVSGVGKTFEYEGRKFKVLCSAVRIPGLGRRTALEILDDTKAQAWLVEKKSGVIKELK